jgi:hypothetical protein
VAQSTYSSQYFVGLTARRCGLIASYEALLRYPVHPFSIQSLSAVTKLRAALPKDVVAQLDRLRRHVLVAGARLRSPALG